ncbi:ABC transporter substrate-binding protein [Brevibacillus humidisoli]|uniref:ABC transporter substrate-binding protein n=1 Tax=Brevibacillus humidisoli TaxID=2895522 RepID=UPI001E4288FD|nr:ABC transporter substrate-binding protein [Brevibacillus humidisoli]UFJ41551.1 ABC transporter substrate-binding protein [Brevibacillus humidisoli]
MTAHLRFKWPFYISLVIAVLLTGCTDGQSAPPPPASDPAPAAESESESATPKSGGQLVVGSIGGLPVFDPFGTAKQEAALTPYESLAYEGLLVYGEDGLLKANLASDYRLEKVDGKPVVTLSLPKQRKWADGKPITVEDVRFTLETYSRPDYYGVWRESTHLIEGVSRFRRGKDEHISGITVAPEQGTVRISLDRDDVAFLPLLTAPLLPQHQLQGKSLDEISSLSIGGQLIGTGIFQPQQMSEQEWVFAANGSYHGEKPLLDSVKVIPLQQEKVGEEVASGRVHISMVSPEVAHLLNEQDTAVQIKTAEAHGYHFIGYNLASEKLQDLVVRQALSQAVPVEKIVDELFYSFAQPVKSPLHPASFAYEAGVLPGFDPKAAQAVLKEKGYSQEKPLVLTMVYPSGSQVRQRLVDALLEAWKSLPVKVETKPLQPDEFHAYLFGGQATDLYLYAWQYPLDPSELIKIWHSRERVGELGLNASRWTNPQADQLLEKGQLLLDEKERQKLFGDWQKQFAADLPILPLVEVQNPYCISTRLHGVADRLGMQPFREIGSWWLE